MEEDAATQSSGTRTATEAIPGPVPTPPTTTTTTTAEDLDSADPDPDPDPIVASYTVYTNPTLPTSRQLLVLQQPNRKLSSLAADSQSSSDLLAISEVRLKPRTGMVEVDVPVSHSHADYDREKGLRWGSALQRSVAAKNGGSLGLAGGFGVGVPAGKGGGKTSSAGGGGGGGGGGRRGGFNEEDLDMDMLADWSEAVRQDKVLRTQTLGGQYPLGEESNCRYMVGVFQGDQLHLTPATSLIHLRPQLHHIDAFTEQERLSRPREAGGGGGAAASSSSGTTAGQGAKDGSAAGSSGGSGSGGGGGGGGGSGAAPRAITMTIKSASTNEIAQETMTDRLRAVQTEPWSKLRYEHDTSDRAWDMFSSHLVYKGLSPPPPPPPSSSSTTTGNTTATVKDRKGKGKGKGKEGGQDDDDGHHHNRNADNDHSSSGEKKLEAEAPRLTARWSENEFLRAVSGRVEEGPEGDGHGHDDVVVVAAAAAAAKLAADEVKKEEGRVVATTATAAAAAAAGSSKAKGKGRATATAAAGAAPATKRAAGGKGKSVAFKGTAMEID